MTQNLKVELLYYQMNTDFEMEFHLSGCCRMRLITEKSESAKDYLKHLALAVSRSRIIINCGHLFGEDGLINTVASAIGKGIETVNNAEYGINSDQPIDIISGSVPLVTREGYFGGCIIESGPQTIVLLTENKPIRKSIMKNLIHPYVTEMSKLPDEQADGEPVKINEEIPQETTEQEKEELVEETLTPPAPAPENEIEMFVEPGFEKKSFKRSYYGEGFEQYDDGGIITDDGEDEDENYSKMDFALVIFGVIAFLCIASLCYMLVINPLMNGVPIKEHIRELFEISSNITGV